MPDNLTPEQRRRCMSANRGKDTLLELDVRSTLRRRGLRFTTHARDLPGRPDIAFRAARVVVFVDGDFWHGYRFPKWQVTLTPFWREKIRRNRERDRRNFQRLRRMGWTVIRLWEHEVDRDVAAAASRIEAAVRAAFPAGRAGRRRKLLIRKGNPGLRT